MILPKRDVIDVTKKTIFSSEPSLFHLDVPEGFQALNVRLGNLYFVVYTLDPDFSKNPKRFEGEIQIMHDSGQATRMDMLKLKTMPVIFRFPEKDGKKEALVCYVYKNFLSKLEDC